MREHSQWNLITIGDILYHSYDENISKSRNFRQGESYNAIEYYGKN